MARKEIYMLSALLPVDGSDNAMRAVRHVVDKQHWYQGPIELHLLNVQMPIASGLVKSFISKNQINDYYRDEGLAALEAARAALDAGRIAYQYHVGVGEPAATILEYARTKQCELIVMGTHGRGVLGSVALGSVATRVLHQASIPVLLVK